MFPIRQQLALRMEAVLPVLSRRVGVTRKHRKPLETRLLERAGALFSLLASGLYVPAGAVSYHGLEEGLPPGGTPFLGLDAPGGALECAHRAFRGR